jgi:hypothetical protein
VLGAPLNYHLEMHSLWVVQSHFRTAPWDSLTLFSGDADWDFPSQLGSRHLGTTPMDEASLYPGLARDTLSLTLMRTCFRTPLSFCSLWTCSLTQSNLQAHHTIAHGSPSQDFGCHGPNAHHSHSGQGTTLAGPVWDLDCPGAGHPTQIHSTLSRDRSGLPLLCLTRQAASGSLATLLM